MDLAIDKCPCADTYIHLYRGADASVHLETRDRLLIFLKGSKTAKDTLRQEKPNCMIGSNWCGMSAKTICSVYFMLNCCFDKECPHPVCKKGRPSEMPRWYKDGPAITHLPLPVVDMDRPWENTICSACKAFVPATIK